MLVADLSSACAGTSLTHALVFWAW